MFSLRRIATTVACAGFLAAASGASGLGQAQGDIFDAMLNYYKRNYPAKVGADLPPAPEFPKVKASVLVFHGLDDFALHKDGLAGTWNWVEKDLTLVTIPGASHFVQQDAADLVTSTLLAWLPARTR